MSLDNLPTTEDALEQYLQEMLGDNALAATEAADVPGAQLGLVGEAVEPEKLADADTAEDSATEVEVPPALEEQPQRPEIAKAHWRADLGADVEPPAFQWECGKRDCVLLEIVGVQFACPFEYLDKPIAWPDDVCQMPESLPFIGTRSAENGNRVLVDLAHLFLPGKRAPLQAVAGGMVVPYKSAPWDLICDELQGVIAIEHAEVQWNLSQEKRPWLAGMAQRHHCAVLNPVKLAEILFAEWDKIA